MPDEDKNFLWGLSSGFVDVTWNDLYLKCAAQNVSCNTGTVWHSVRRPVIINKRKSLDIQRFTLVRQLFRVACHSMSVESPVFSRYRPVYIQAGSSICYTTTERRIAILHRAIENTVTNTINAACVRRMMGSLIVIPSKIQWLSWILIGCISYSVV